MKTLIVESTGELEVRNVSMPVISEYQALVKITSCGICNGTAAKLIHGTFKGYNLNQYPLMLGHEAVGYVVDIGNKVLSLKEGDLVLLPFNDKIDGVNSAWGGFSEYGIVNDYESVKLYDPTNYYLHGLASRQTVLPNWNLIFHQFPSKKEEHLAHNQVINWLESGDIHLKNFISDVFDFRDIILAFDKLDNRKITKKGIIKF